MRRLLPGVFGLALLCCGVAVAQEKAPIVLVLHADMSSGSAMAGEAIRRGALIAISELNAQGGLLDGRKLELVVRDHHGVPARATEQLPELASMPHLVAILSGLHSPPVIQNLPFIHEHQLIVVSPWAAATGMVQHELTPNYVFRVSIDDERVGEFLVARALARGHKRLGVILEKSAWGRSNEKALLAALARRNLKPASVQWFNWADADMETHLAAVERAGAEALLMVANAPEGAAIVRTVARRPPGKRLPIYAHSGIIGGDFVRQSGEALSGVDLRVVHTFSFLGNPSAKARAVAAKYHTLFGTQSDEEIFSDAGTAQAYDAVWLLALAIQKAKSTERPRVRDALERLGSYQGLVRTYQPAFTPSRHEALSPSDFKLATFNPRGVLVLSQP
ncbi:ABC transporter substrate-binding protein [Archangium lansingense]|uniref:ABC transporter substrate-binding protein n=1 Tax=Archangium lansingense TaxID=2995310 RepID=A0ABT4A0J6_9BACT|nr:ABC transporter substrate-binding protein [Archangium lansinium]MCY1075128.1 ABC transporter substrate-binding protein [Archangium lansinium]